VRDGLEFQNQIAGLAGFTEQREPGGLAGAGRQRGVTESTAPPLGGDESAAGAGQVRQQVAVRIEDHGAVGHLHLEVGAGGAVPVAALPRLARGGDHVGMEVEVEQGVHLRIDHQDHTAAAATVAAIGPAERSELLAVHGGAAMPAVARAHMDDYAVNEPRHLNFTPYERNATATSGFAGRRGVTSRSSGLRSAGWYDADDFASALAGELDRTGSGGEQGVVTAAADVQAGVEAGAALPHQDLAGLDDLAAEPLDAESLGG